MINSSHKQIQNEQTKFEKYLLKFGLNLTEGRKAVFEEVMYSHGHFAAEELVKNCKINKRKVSRATIYRALRELLEAGIIRETAFGEKHHLFEHIYDEKPHHHARCIRCGTITEFPDLQEDKIYEPILENKGFTIIGHEMHFYGICKDCQNKQ